MVKSKFGDREMRFGDKFMKYGSLTVPLLNEFSIIVEPDDAYVSMEMLWGFGITLRNGYSTYKGDVIYMPVEKIEHGKGGKVEIKFRFMEIKIEDIEDVEYV